MALNELDRQTIINSLTAANNAIGRAIAENDRIRLELDVVRAELVKIMRDVIFNRDNALGLTAISYSYPYITASRWHGNRECQVNPIEDNFQL